MAVVFKILIAEMLARKTRLLLTLLAVVAAACMVVWVVSGYDGLIRQFDSFAEESQGRYGLAIVSSAAPAGSPNTPAIALELEDAMLGDLANDPAIESVDVVSQTNVSLNTNAATQRSEGRRGGPGGGGGRPSDATSQPARGGGGRGGPTATLAGIDAKVPPFELPQGRWINGSGEAVVSSILATSANLTLGQSIGVSLPARAGERPSRRPIRVTIVGITQQASAPSTPGARGGPRVLGPAANAIYVTRDQFESFAGNRDINYVGLALKEDADPRGVASRWTSKLSPLSATLQSPSDIEDSLESQGQATSMKQQAYAATGIAMMAALFIIFTTLSMGMSERIRQLAMLRSIALTRLQVGSLVLLEGLMLGVIGWVGGLFAGWLLLRLIKSETPLALGTYSLLLTGGCALGGAVVASLIPAWQGMRISPLMAMKPSMPRLASSRISLVSVIGFVLIALNPLLVFVLLKPGSPLAPMLSSNDTLYNLYLAIGCTSMALGFILLAPLAIVLSERMFGPLLAKALLITPSLLSSQLRSNLWRTLGTTVAMTIGLGLYASMQVWGYSMLNPFVPGDWAPQYTIGLMSTRVDEVALSAFERIPAFEGGRLERLEVVQPTLTSDPLHSRERSSVTRQDNIIIIGLDPLAAIGPGKMLDLEYVEGNAADAAAKLAAGGAILVPDHFARETKLKLGDPVEVNIPGGAGQTASYAVAGIVKEPGWHWLTKFNGTRLTSGRSGGLIYASAATIARDFPEANRSQFFFANVKEKVTQADIETQGVAALQQATGTRFGIAEFSRGPLMPGTDSASTLRVTATQTIRDRIGARADGMIWEMSKLPLVTLAVTSLGVVNAMLAAVRARRFEMGILRSVGYTRSALLRMVLAEAILVGIVACVLSVSFGLMAGWCGAGISQYVSFFGGLQPPVVVPIKQLTLGIGMAIGLCILAALWPAIQAGLTRPLQLLQAGRAAT